GEGLRAAARHEPARTAGSLPRVRSDSCAPAGDKPLTLSLSHKGRGDSIAMPRLPPRGGSTPRDRALGLRYDAESMRGPTIDWQAQDWDDLVPRLLLLAVSRLQRMTWRGQRRGSPPGAREAEDFVNDAISKTIAGVRIWNPEACTLFQHVAGVIVSDISHAAESMENRTTLREAAGNDPGTSPIADVGDDAPDQEATAVWRSEQ